MSPMSPRQPLPVVRLAWVASLLVLSVPLAAGEAGAQDPRDVTARGSARDVTARGSARGSARDVTAREPARDAAESLAVRATMHRVVASLSELLPDAIEADGLADDPRSGPRLRELARAAQQIEAIVDATQDVRGHGLREMPVWGLTFSERGRDVGNREVAAERIADIVAWLQSIQRE